MWFHLHYSTKHPPPPSRSTKNNTNVQRSSQDSGDTAVEESLDDKVGRQSSELSRKTMSVQYTTNIARTGAPVASAEYEKMISCAPFRVLHCPQLQYKKLEARQFCAKYNVDDLIVKDASMPLDQLFVALRQEREKQLRTIIGVVGDSPVIEPPFNFQYGCNIALGDRFYANVNLRILDSGLVTIGNRVLIGPNVTIITERHDKDVQSRRDGIVYAQPVQIGDDCWIGVGTTILPGVTIGRGAVIGACSVVTRDIPPMSVAWGAPARVVHGVPDPDAMESEIMVTDY